MFDELNDALLAAEQQLRLSGFTAGASTAIKEYEYVLGFGKHRDWILYVAKNDDRDPAWVHIPKASLELRCLAAHALPDLLVELREAQRRQSQTVTQAVVVAREFARLLELGR